MSKKFQSLVAIFALAFLCPVVLRSEDSHWFAVPENASFEQLRDFAGKLRGELIKRNKEHFDKHIANQLTQEENDAVTEFREQYEETLEIIIDCIKKLPEPTKESKVFVLDREWNIARRIDHLEPRIAGLKNLLDLCENDPDLAEIKREIYNDWFRYSLMGASLPQLDQLFEQFLTYLQEDESQAVYLCDTYFKRLAGLQPEDLREKMEDSLGEIRAVLEKSQNESVKNFLPRIEGAVRFYTVPGQEMELQGVLMDGSEFGLADLKGKVVYVDFWAVWCGPCVGKMPDLHAKYLTLKEAGFEVLSYSIDEDYDALVAFMDKMQYTWPVISVLKSQEKGFRNYYEYYGGGGVPKTVLIGRDGKAIRTDLHWFILEEELGKLFGDEMERKALDPDTPAAFKLEYFLNHAMRGAKPLSEELCESIIAFLENNKDGLEFNMGSLCRQFISHLETMELLTRQEISPKYQSLTVFQRLASSLKDAENRWLQECTETLEGKIRGRELPGKPMELEGLLPDGRKFDIKDFHGKPVVACFYAAWQRPNLPNIQTMMPFTLEKLKSYDAKYAGQDLGIVVYLTGKEHQDFPEPDETMQGWKIITAEDSVAAGMKNYRDYYGFTSTPNWFLIDRDGNVINTNNARGGAPDQALEALMQE